MSLADCERSVKGKTSEADASHETIDVGARVETVRLGVETLSKHILQSVRTALQTDGRLPSRRTLQRKNKTGRYIELEKELVSAQISRPTGKEFDSRTASAEASSYTSSSRAIMTRFLPRACSQSLKRPLQRVALTTRQVTTDKEGAKQAIPNRSL